jgi:hypothetical protein
MQQLLISSSGGRWVRRRAGSALLVWNTQRFFVAMWIRGEEYSMADEGYNYVIMKATTTVHDDESYNYRTKRTTTT